MNQEIDQLADKLGIKFDNLDILKTALTHRSYLNEHVNIKEHNERLEFLGDAVLELVVTEYLYKNYQNPEGELTNWRSALVKTETISDASKELGLEDYISMSKGEARSFGRSRQLILANAFEAVIGAIFLDQGIKVAQTFIEKNLIVKLDKILQEKLYVDPKSLFQEIVQDKEGVTPHYEVLKAEGPDHDKEFTIGVFVDDKKWGEGVGPSKQAAQQAAANDALKNFK
jgi:ribonuclease-3